MAPGKMEGLANPAEQLIPQPVYDPFLLLIYQLRDKLYINLISLTSNVCTAGTRHPASWEMLISKFSQHLFIKKTN